MNNHDSETLQQILDTACSESETIGQFLADHTEIPLPIEILLTERQTYLDDQIGKAIKELKSRGIQPIIRD